MDRHLCLRASSALQRVHTVLEHLHVGPQRGSLAINPTSSKASSKKQGEEKDKDESLDTL